RPRHPARGRHRRRGHRARDLGRDALCGAGVRGHRRARQDGAAPARRRRPARRLRSTLRGALRPQPRRAAGRGRVVPGWRGGGAAEIRLDEIVGAGEALIERRAAYFPEAGGFIETPVYARLRLPPGREVTGPALIEEAESTAVVGPDARVVIDGFGNMIMRLAP